MRTRATLILGSRLRVSWSEDENGVHVVETYSHEGNPEYVNRHVDDTSAIEDFRVRCDEKLR